MLGAKSRHADECFKGGFIGHGWFEKIDLTDQFPDERKKFNEKFVPVYLNEYEGKTKPAAGLACGATWTICKGINNGDIVLCPDGHGNYKVGEITEKYSYCPNSILPHRRKVNWYQNVIQRSVMSQALQNSTGSIGTVSNITKYSGEIEKLISGDQPAKIISTDESIEDPTAFTMEKYLEEFLVANWSQTLLGEKYDIFEEDGELIGQQYPTDTGRMDILAISKDKKELLVVELKKGRSSDAVVGQIQSYMGYAIEELAEEGQSVRGVIIALEDDKRMRRALTVAKEIDFYRYEVRFKLV